MVGSSDDSACDAADRKIVDGLVERLALQRSLATAPESTQCMNQRVEALAAELSARHSISRERIKALLRHIASVCAAEHRPSKVAFLGPRHSYSHLAAIAYFGEATETIPEPTIASVFDSVVRKQADSGIVPVENSTDGRVVDTLSMFVRNPVNICGEVLLPIHHFLLSRTPRDQIQEIYSKPQAISQCRQWLAKHMPAAALKEISSTAAAAELTSRQDGTAAIASEAAGRQYGLDVVAAQIEDNPNNVTRFAVLGNQEPSPTGHDKTSLLFQVVHQPGALADAMTVFKNHKLNLTWIESFPMPEAPSEYLFFVELDGHKDDSALRDALADLDKLTLRCEVLGSYPKGIPSTP